MSILSYNIRGFKTKIKNANFLSFLKTFSIICLIETFVTADSTNLYENCFPEYELHWENAIRESNKGRASGGILVGVRKDLKITTRLKDVNGNKLFLLKLNDFEMYIIPVYLNCNRWTQCFENLENTVLQLQHKAFLCIGDLNVRVGSEQNLPEEITENLCYDLASDRISKDRVYDARGKKLIEFCDFNNIIILNGRTKNDATGEFTYIEKVGQSVNDIAMISGDVLNELENLDFRVKPEIHSDHLPIIVDLAIECNVTNQTEKKCTPLMPKLLWVEKNKIEYKKKLELICAQENNVVQNGDVQVKLNEILDKIKLAAGREMIVGENKKTYKEHWYDSECEKERKKTFKLLNIYRDTDNETFKLMYCNQKKTYEVTRERKKKEYYESVFCELKMVRDSTRFWKLTNIFRNRKAYMAPTCPVSDLINHFYDLLNPPMIAKAIEYTSSVIEDPHLDKEITLSEVERAVNKLKNNKAPGLDRIPSEYYKNAPKGLLVEITELLNRIMFTGKVPDSFKISALFPLHKRGDVSLAENFRGICFMDAILNIFTSILLERLTFWVDERKILTEFQAGFRSGYSTIDNLFNLFSIVETKLKKKRSKLYGFYIDLKAAFDRIERKSLFYKLHQIGISSKLINIIAELYDGNRVLIMTKDGVSDPIESETGVRQGCLLSPLLFLLFLNDLLKALGGGVRMDGVRVKGLLYADDIILLAEDPVSLQLMINDLEVYLDQWNLILSEEKSKVMIFKKGGGKPAKNENWTYKGQNLITCKDYKYLGITINANFNNKQHFRQRASQAYYGLNSVWKRYVNSKDVTLEAKKELFRSVTRSVLCYGGEVWGLEQNESIEAVQRYFYKKLFNLPQNTPNYIIYTELKLDPLYLHTMELHFNYVNKVLGKYTDDRLPKVLANQAINGKLGWFSRWVSMGEKYGLEFKVEGNYLKKWKGNTQKIIEFERKSFRDKFREQARNSEHHRLYASLNWENDGGCSYIFGKMSFASKQLVFRIRAEMLNLNYKWWNDIGTQKCSLCNLDELETTEHFLGVCPILKEFRFRFFDKLFLAREEILQMLNGRSLGSVVNFVREAMNYRKELILEFNF